MRVRGTGLTLWPLTPPLEQPAIDRKSILSKPATTPLLLTHESEFLIYVTFI
jgi:hypothetical protein